MFGENEINQNIHKGKAMKTGYYGKYGGKYVSEILMPAISELEQSFNQLKDDVNFQKDFAELLKKYVGRPSPITFCPQLSSEFGARIYLKREDLNHTGAHKINNALGQALLAKRLGKKRVIAETGAGQHGVATATACAKLGLECEVYMGEKDMERQKPNVFRMELMGGRVIPVTSGTKTLKDAINEALRDWSSSVESTHYLLGSVLGPHPFPEMVAYFQSVIGKESREQILSETGQLPEAVIACVGGGSNAIGIFKGFLEDENIELIGVEAGGQGIKTGKHAARFADPDTGRPGIVHGTKTYVLQDKMGQIMNTHSVSAGLDYCAVGPEHSYLHEKNRVAYTSVTDQECLDAFCMLSEKEGIIPALESAHAVAYAQKYAKKLEEDDIILINLSGRGDKDIFEVKKILEAKQTVK